MTKKWDFPLYLYDGPVAYVLVSDAAERIQQAFEAGRKAALADLGLVRVKPERERRIPASAVNLLGDPSPLIA
jgi:hypothetical protein